MNKYMEASLMWPRFVRALILGFWLVVVAACGGGGGPETSSASNPNQASLNSGTSPANNATLPGALSGADSTGGTPPANNATLQGGVSGTDSSGAAVSSTGTDSSTGAANTPIAMAWTGANWDNSVWH
jgi:hypothetical protein